jgi:ubiquinone/menaquinone biosynthesis C-methylase UbiE
MSLPPPAAASSSPMQLPEAWDACAPDYAERAMPFMFEFAREALDRLAAGAGDQLLDVAAGTGSLSLIAATRVQRVVAVDFSAGMIEQLKARAERDGLTNLETKVMDAQALALPDAGFDLATCLFGFMFFPDRARAFSELHRVLEPGGRALVGTWSPIERRPFLKLGFDAMAETIPDMPKPQKGDLQQADECEREMSAAGFRDVRCAPFTASARFESPEHYVTMMDSSVPFTMLRNKLGPEGWAQTRARLLEAVRRRMPDSGAELAGEALFTIGTR